MMPLQNMMRLLHETWPREIHARNIGPTLNFEPIRQMIHNGQLNLQLPNTVLDAILIHRAGGLHAEYTYQSRTPYTEITQADRHHILLKLIIPAVLFQININYEVNGRSIPLWIIHTSSPGQIIDYREFRVRHGLNNPIARDLTSSFNARATNYKPDHNWDSIHLSQPPVPVYTQHQLDEIENLIAVIERQRPDTERRRAMGY